MKLAGALNTQDIKSVKSSALPFGPSAPLNIG